MNYYWRFASLIQKLIKNKHKYMQDQSKNIKSINLQLVKLQKHDN